MVITTTVVVPQSPTNDPISGSNIGHGGGAGNGPDSGSNGSPGSNPNGGSGGSDNASTADGPYSNNGVDEQDHAPPICSGPTCPPLTSTPGNPGGESACTGVGCPSNRPGSGQSTGTDNSNGDCTGLGCPAGNSPGSRPAPYGASSDNSNGAVPPDDDVGEGDDGIAARVAPIAGGWSYLGCFNDNPQRTLDCDPRDYYAGNMSNEKCVAYCDSKGFKLAGTEYHRECWCGNVFQNAKRLPDMQCRMVCDGNPAELCGGSWALTVYSKDGTAVNRPADTNEVGSYGGTSGEKRARGMYDANYSENPGPTPVTTLVTAARPAGFAPQPQTTGLPSGPRLFTARIMGV
ncbi:hypothetical protein D7B24_007121 [Verticillium nonalfalfae]|uniref:WSC domain-containing protein n=1 Tax=Verticillium nonalfalfae TaxID=1051616 RepID=A0A3M9Y9S6_9PEZI|nr:uncharacterized protein D7B24_007121 [Verticillium nonalfalfae]RNJ56516.1 hypothetical protein D7B24_007121 [Verticillium nonalfalfae]